MVGHNFALKNADNENGGVLFNDVRIVQPNEKTNYTVLIVGLLNYRSIYSLFATLTPCFRWFLRKPVKSYPVETFTENIQLRLESNYCNSENAMIDTDYFCAIKKGLVI
jgi:hypothetical protein